MRTYNHVVLTRFNLPTPGSQGVIRAREGWLRDRVNLFEKYCLPAIESQTCRNFTWLVYFDPQSPGWLLDRIAEYSERGPLKPIFRESANEAQLLSDIESAVDSKGNDLITTNLDNDDAVAASFFARIQSARTIGKLSAVYLANGLIRSQDRLYLHHYPRNAFNSVRSSWCSPMTCWADWHTDFDRIMPVVEIGGQPAWMQVVHDSNVSNRIKGFRISPAPFRDEFGLLLGGITEPTSSELRRDRWLDRPLRDVRDSGRMVLKRTILLTLGRDGIDRSRRLWRRARSSFQH